MSEGAFTASNGITVRIKADQVIFDPTLSSLGDLLPPSVLWLGEPRVKALREAFRSEYDDEVTLGLEKSDTNGWVDLYLDLGDGDREHGGYFRENLLEQTIQALEKYRAAHPPRNIEEENNIV